ncbi:MAG: DUF4102 domain-containing protein, partial [Rhizobiales bacterium]|nr:DUF4102 domain-containing protein [Hyphomicrobiales bacterium]
MNRKDKEALRRQKLDRAMRRLRPQAEPKLHMRKSELFTREKLTVKRIEKLLNQPGRYGDEHVGLYLQVRSHTNASWLFRYQRNGRERWMGLGSLRTYSRDEAVERAKEADRTLNGYTHIDPKTQKREVFEPTDPVDARRAKRAGGDGVTFKEACEAWLAVNSDNWKNEKFKSQADQIFKDFVFPKIGTVPIAKIEKRHIIEVLEQRVPEEQGRPAGPFFKVRAETAKRCRLRLHGVIARAIDIGQRTDKSNPADWAGVKLAVP